MKTTNDDKFITFQNKLNEADKEISAMDEPFTESYDPSVTTLKETLISIFEGKTSEGKKSEDNSVETGMKLFDSHLDGLKNGELTLIGINSNYFSPAATIIASMLKEKHLPCRVGLISAKQSAEDFAIRFLSIFTDSSQQLIKNMFLSEKDFSKAKTACEKIYDEPLFINDNLYPAIEEFKAAALKLRFENDVQLLLVDSFECVGREITFENAFEKKRRFTRLLKELARFMNIPVVVISYFSDTRIKEEDYAASGIGFGYADNIVFYDVQNTTSGNEKLNGMTHILKSKSGKLAYSIYFNTKTSGLEESY